MRGQISTCRTVSWLGATLLLVLSGSAEAADKNDYPANWVPVAGNDDDPVGTSNYPDFSILQLPLSGQHDGDRQNERPVL